MSNAVTGTETHSSTSVEHADDLIGIETAALAPGELAYVHTSHQFYFFDPEDRSRIDGFQIVAAKYGCGRWILTFINRCGIGGATGATGATGAEGRVGAAGSIGPVGPQGPPIYQYTFVTTVTSAGTTVFPLETAPTRPETALLFVNGLAGTLGADYTISGSTLTWIGDFLLTVGDVIHCLYQ